MHGRHSTITRLKAASAADASHAQLPQGDWSKELATPAISRPTSTEPSRLGSRLSAQDFFTSSLFPSPKEQLAQELAKLTASGLAKTNEVYTAEDIAILRAGIGKLHAEVISVIDKLVDSGPQLDAILRIVREISSAERKGIVLSLDKTISSVAATARLNPSQLTDMFDLAIGGPSRIFMLEGLSKILHAHIKGFNPVISPKDDPISYREFRRALIWIDNCFYGGQHVLFALMDARASADPKPDERKKGPQSKSERREEAKKAPQPEPIVKVILQDVRFTLRTLAGTMHAPCRSIQEARYPRLYSALIDHLRTTLRRTNYHLTNTRMCVLSGAFHDFSENIDPTSAKNEIISALARRGAITTQEAQKLYALQ